MTVFQLATRFIAITLFLMLSACANNAGLELERQQQKQAAQQTAALEAAREAEARHQEELARQEAEQQRQREAQARQLTEEARAAAEAAERAAAEEARRQAAELASQQARIEALRAQVQAINEQTRAIESNNATLNEALSAAEALTTALSEENAKFTTIDPQTGELPEEFDAERISELSARLNRLREQAAALQAP